jgi:hypothetical protein
MSHPSHSSGLDHRPEFMVTLGLAPPYAIEDVHQAYREKAKQAHPDRGGSTAAFNEIHQAFERAQEYLAFRGDRRAWIAGRMKHYMAVEDAIARLVKLGASVQAAAPEWLERSFGDFAQLTETAVLIRALDAPNGDALINALVEHHTALRELETLELPGCGVTDEAALRLGVFQQLKRLNLARTRVTNRVTALVDELPMLESLSLDGTAVSWWSRRRTASRLRRRASA